jgi:hypothetical protein
MPPLSHSRWSFACFGNIPILSFAPALFLGLSVYAGSRLLKGEVFLYLTLHVG